MKYDPAIWPHVSASQIKTFSLCPRKWHYSKFAGLPRPAPSPAILLGKEIHAQLETYLLHGTPPTHRRASSSLRYLPASPVPPGDVEREIRIPTRPGLPPVLGYIDLIIPGPVPEIVDHKTMGSWTYAQTKETLAHDPQMVIYSKHALETGCVSAVRVTHHQIRTKGAALARRISAILTPSEIDARFENIVSVVAEMAKFPAYKSPDVPCNPNGCGAFGGCEYADICPQTATKPAGASIFHSIKNNTNKDQEMTTPNRTLAEIIAERNKQTPGGEILPPDAPSRTQEAPKPPGGLFLTAPTNPNPPPAPTPAPTPTQTPGLPKSSTLTKKDLTDAAGRVVQGMEADGTTSITAAEFKKELCLVFNKKRLGASYLDAVASAVPGLLSWDEKTLSRAGSPSPAPAPTPSPAPEPTPTPTPAPTPAPDAGLTIFVDCLPEKGITGVPLSVALAPLVETIADATGCDPLLIPYNEGTKKVAALLRVSPISGVVFVDSRDPYWVAAAPFLRNIAEKIVRGVR